MRLSLIQITVGPQIEKNFKKVDKFINQALDFKPNLILLPECFLFLSNIIFAVDEEVKTLNCKKNSKRGCNSKTTKCITHNLWDQLDRHINGFFEKVKLQDLTKLN